MLTQDHLDKFKTNNEWAANDDRSSLLTVRESKALIAAPEASQEALKDCMRLVLDDWSGCSEDSEGIVAYHKAKAALIPKKEA